MFMSNITDFSTPELLNIHGELVRSFGIDVSEGELAEILRTLALGESSLTETRTGLARLVEILYTWSITFDEMPSNAFNDYSLNFTIDGSGGRELHL